MISIGLTGGLASGKSLVARIFKSLGCALIDTDAIARDIAVPGTEAWQAVVKEFGPQILTENNTLDRPKLAGIIFADAGRRQILNSILHPLIISSVRQQLAEIGAREPDALVVVDVPLLIECGLQNDFDEVIVVWTPRETQIKRLMERDVLPEAEARQRLAAQLPLDQKRSYATFVVENDADQGKTEAQVRRILSDLQRGRRGRR
jgi:dephospho-CoA kinase